MGALVETLLGESHDVLWFVAPIDIDNSEVRRLKVAGARVALLPPETTANFIRFGGVRRRLQAMARRGPGLTAAVAEFGAEHLFLNQGGTWSGLHHDFAELLADFPNRYSLICHLSRPDPPFSAQDLARARALMRNAKAVFFNSAWTRRVAEMQIAESIANARSFQCPVRFRFKSPLPWPATPVPTLAMVNRLDTFQKGIDIALEALALLRAEGRHLRLNIYGSGPEEAYLKDLSRFLGVSDAVGFQGHRDDLERVWAENEMLVLPSRFEGLSVAMLEAMGFGRPVLRTPLGGAEEWVEDGETGYLCPCADPHALATTLRRALAERDRWREMGLRAHLAIGRGLDPDPARVFLSALGAN